MILRQAGPAKRGASREAGSSQPATGHGIGRRWACAWLSLFLVLPSDLSPAIIEVSGTCTLIDAVTSANTDTAVGGCVMGSGPDTLVLTESVILNAIDNVDMGANALPVVSTAVTLDGSGFSVTRDQGGSDFRFFRVSDMGALTLTNVTLSHGRATAGGYYAPGKYGGAIHSSGQLEVLSSELSYNYAEVAGGAIFTLGGGTLTQSTVNHNTAGDGGAISNRAGTFDIYESTLMHNFASNGYGGGGAIVNSETMEVAKSTLAYNIAAQDYGLGGAIHNGGTLVVFNSTLFDNFSAYGGAISNSSAGDVTIAQSTLVNNSSRGEEGGGEALFAFIGGGFSIGGSILKNADSDNQVHNCSSIVADLGRNLADDTSCGTIPLSVIGVDSALSDNGGPTRTMALLPESPAVDQGACPVLMDQRSVPRDDGSCDSGSFEVGPCGAPNGRDFVLESGMTTSEDTYEACWRLLVRNQQVLGPDGHLILRAGISVRLDDGTSVGPGARVTVEIDDALAGVPKR